MTAARDPIITAWAEYSNGPGWSNSLVWVLRRDGNGKLYMDAIQPPDQSRDMVTLFNVAAASANALTAAVERSEKK